MSMRAKICLYALFVVHIGLICLVLYGMLVCSAKHEVRHTPPPAQQYQATEPESAEGFVSTKRFRNLDVAIANAVRQAVNRAMEEAAQKLVDEVMQSLYEAAMKVFYATALILLCWQLFCIVLLLCRRSWGYLFLWVPWAVNCALAVVGAILLLAVLQEIGWLVLLLPGLAVMHAACLIVLYWLADVKQCVFWNKKAVES